MLIHTINAFSDNYIWALQMNENERTLTIVDPGDADPVRVFCRQNDFTVKNILLTHHHSDHTGGVSDLKADDPAITVYGPSECREWVDHVLAPDDTLALDAATIRILDASGHTEHHIAYLIDQRLFCGDAMFAFGCGRVFTGDYAAAYQTMQRFAALPDTTAVYPGHEYTIKNLRFLRTLGLEDTAAVDALINQAETKLAAGQPAVPTTIKTEKRWNPFMKATSLENFIRYRNARDGF